MIEALYEIKSDTLKLQSDFKTSNDPSTFTYGAKVQMFLHVYIVYILILLVSEITFCENTGEIIATLVFGSHSIFYPWLSWLPPVVKAREIFDAF